MPDIEKVIKGLECCFRGNDCRNCPYKEVFNPERPDLDCIDMTREDAIALLKEQQEQIDKLLEESASNAEFAEGLKELLKEQEAVEPKKESEDMPEEWASWWYVCGNCGREIDWHDRYCRHCGKAVKWNE